MQKLIFQGAMVCMVLPALERFGGAMGDVISHKRLGTVKNREEVKGFYSNILKLS